MVECRGIVSYSCLFSLQQWFNIDYVCGAAQDRNACLVLMLE
jgi:hypothetical protein